MAKTEGIYSPALRTRTVGTYRTPSAGQHKAMLKAQGIKYKGLTNKEIIAKARKFGDIKQTKRKKKLPKLPDDLDRDIAVIGLGVLAEKYGDITGKTTSAIRAIVNQFKKLKSSKPEAQTGRPPRNLIVKKKREDKFTTKTLPNIIKDLKKEKKRSFSKGGGVRSSKYKL